MPAAPHPRLVVLTHEFFPHRGGIAVYAAEMAAGAAKLGYRVEVWAPALPPDTPEPPWPFSIRRLPMDGSHSLRSQWTMAKAILAARDTWDDAILYVPEPGPLLALLLLQFFDCLPGGRLVFTLHGSEILQLAMRPLTRWGVRRLFNRASQISVVSGYAENLLLQFFPNLSAKVVRTPGALRHDFHALPPAAPKPPSQRLIILTVARLHPRKGQHRVIQALQALPATQRQHIEYWLVGAHGKENYEQLLQATANEAGFIIRFLGDVADDRLAEIYRQADIFAMTSMPHKLSIEGFGLVYLEAGAHGLPVVAHAIGGVPEAVLDGETGLLVSPDDPAALTAAFARLIDDDGLRAKFGAAGRTRALSRTWEDAARTLFGPPVPPSS